MNGKAHRKVHVIDKLILGFPVLFYMFYNFHVLKELKESFGSLTVL